MQAFIIVVKFWSVKHEGGHFIWKQSKSLLGRPTCHQGGTLKCPRQNVHSPLGWPALAEASKCGDRILRHW